MCRSIRYFLFGLAVAWLYATSPAAAERRVALVIGNSNYAHVAKLANPESDARAIAATLKSLGFETVELVINQPAASLRAAVQRFSRAADDAEVALVFYAGHGIEVGGANYLIPIDAQIKTDVDVEFETLSLDLVMRSIESASRLRVVILDACRDNPFAKRMTMTRGASRSVGRGLARVDPPGDTLVAYAAKAGFTAEDGTGTNSPFTTALLQHMATPGLDIRLMFGRVRDTVAELTRRQQEPFVYGSIGGREIYLRPSPGTAPPLASPPPAAFDPRAIEVSYWESVRNSESPAVIRSYLERYPNGTFAALARARLQELEEKRLAALPPAPPPPRPSVTPSQPSAVPPPPSASLPQPSVTPPSIISAPGRGVLQVGLAGPMTGGNAIFGRQFLQGAEQAITDINAAGGVLGKMLKLEIGDDACDPKQARSVAEKFSGMKLPFVVGHFCSSSSIPASEAYAEAGVLQITPASTNPRFTDRGLWNTLRVCGRDDQQGTVAAAYIARNFKGKNVAILHDKTTYGKGLADETKAALIKLGVREKLYDSFDKGDKDFTALVSKLKRANIDLVFVGSYSQEAALIARQMRDQGLKAVLMAGDALADTEFASLAGPSAEGVLFTFAPDARKKVTAAAVVAKFKAKNFDPEGYTLYTYAAFQAWAQAVAKAGTTDSEKVAATLKSGSWETVLGKISFDNKGDITLLDYVVYRWDRSGNFGEVP